MWTQKLTRSSIKNEVKSRILTANGVLYENANAVRELERFLIQGVRQASV